MAIPITWGPTGEHSYPTPQSSPHNKLRKKSVHFTPPPTASSADIPITPATPPPVVSDFGLPTPEATPEKKKGVFGKIFTKSNKTPHPVIVTAAEPEDIRESWHHHASYFPQYEPIYKDPLTVPGIPGVRTHERYFPSYTPLLTKDGLGPHSSAYAYALDPAVAQAQAHAQAVGHNVVVHYPDLPKFADYNGGKEGNKSGWASAQWGVEGWTGYGCQGDGTKLPDNNGNTFGAPMPKGQEFPKQQGGQPGGQGGAGGGGSSKNKKRNKNKNKKDDAGGGEKAEAEGDGEGGGDGDGGGGGDDE